MVTVDMDKCVGCGRCVTFCPREALKAWGYLEINEEKCSDCFGGLYHFERSDPIQGRNTVLDRTQTMWARNCVENCPVCALDAVEDESVNR